MNKLIGVLTYQAKHRKTYDVLCRLKACGYENIIVYATPFTYKKTYKALIDHRPINTDIDTAMVCKNFGYQYKRIEKYEEADGKNCDCFLVCGAGIIPKEFVKNNLIINAHPGYIPLVRGLDALKWAIYENLPIGVSTHLIGDEVDAGYTIDREEILIKKNDTISSLAEKVYQDEIRMLVEAIEKVNDSHEFFRGEGIVHKRMPNELEKELEKRLEKFKQKILD